MLAAGVATLAGGAMLGRSLMRYRGVEEAVQMREFALARYAPMAHLAGDQDLEFLRKLPGYKPEMGRQFVRERRRLFRLYLKELAADFNVLHKAARQMIAHAPEEHADLVGILARHQMTFWRRLAVIEVQMALVPLGAHLPDVERLINGVAAVHQAVVRTPTARAGAEA
jgi:hypothetical protein